MLQERYNESIGCHRGSEELGFDGTQNSGIVVVDFSNESLQLFGCQPFKEISNPHGTRGSNFLQIIP